MDTPAICAPSSPPNVALVTEIGRKASLRTTWTPTHSRNDVFRIRWCNRLFRDLSIALPREQWNLPTLPVFIKASKYSHRWTSGRGLRLWLLLGCYITTWWRKRVVVIGALQLNMFLVFPDVVELYFKLSCLNSNQPLRQHVPVVAHSTGECFFAEIRSWSYLVNNLHAW